MEKPAAKSKNKILKFLPKAAQAAVSFQNLPFSPRGRDKRSDLNAQRLKTHQNRGFSAPIVSMIPAEARRKLKNFESQEEPTSPKVSCMGQIKQKSKISEKKHASLPKEFKPEKVIKARRRGPDSDIKKKRSGIKKIFGGGRKSDDLIDEGKTPIEDGAPSLGQMRRFASSRDTFANFDWRTVRISPEGDRGFHSDEERSYSDEEDDVIIPFSAPILMARGGGGGGGGGGGAGGGAGLDLEPRKEINLWKRRTMAQPKPLHLDGANSKNGNKEK
ncbi:hypothetical protein CDL12_26115 [Handroanthus impetiginosus]|uniref:Syringolide-induced protein 14-1-1 n=1 Tax=Handroanthus impetiginosus TaxID=429701 RepID=A0A2G9G7U7_9LAMI|nr:hypothetical protein CDL12_26115 [Handroanthus impetiginosus]